MQDESGAPLEMDALFTQHITIVVTDTDSTGIVYTPRIAHYVVEAVEAWFVSRLAMPVRSTTPQMVFASLSCTFLSPMRPGDKLETRVALRHIGRSSLGFEIIGERVSDGRLCWMSETTCVFIDGESFRSRLIPGSLTQALRREAELAIRFPFADRIMGT